MATKTKKEVRWGAPPRDVPGWLKYFSHLPNPDEVLRDAGLDVRAYFSTLRWAHTQAVAETRQLNALRRAVTVSPRDTRDAEAKRAAVMVKDEFDRLKVNRLRSEMWWGAWIGFALAVLEWEQAEIGYRVKRWAVAPQHLVKLGFDKLPQIGGENLGEDRYLLCKSGGSSVFDLYGRGCAQGAFWPSMFLLADWKFWADDVEKFAAPRALATFAPGFVSTTGGQKYVDEVMTALDNLVRGGMASIEADPNFKLIELQHVAAATSAVHDKFQEAGDELISKAVLGQTLSTDGGTIGTGAESLGRVHAETGLLPRIDADLEMLDEALQKLADVICRYRYFRDDLSPVIGHAGPRIQTQELSMIVNDLGLKVSEADAYEMLGISPPEPGAAVVGGRPLGATPTAFNYAPTGRIGLAEGKQIALADVGDKLTSLEQRWSGRLADEYRLMGEAMLRTVKDVTWKPQLSQGRQRVLAKVIRDMILDAQLEGVGQVLGLVKGAGVELAEPKYLQRLRQHFETVENRATIKWHGVGDPASMIVDKAGVIEEISKLNTGFLVPLANDAATAIVYAKAVFPYLEAKARQIEQYAFTIAGVEDQALVDYALGLTAEAAAKGQSVSEFRAALERAFNEAGVSPISPAHAETVLRTNLASAFEGARYDALMSPALAEVFPGFQYVTVGDDRVRPEHVALDGVFFSRDDPRLGEYWAPNDYNCRCTMLALSPEDIHREGLDNAPAAVIDWHPPESFRGAPGAFSPELKTESRRRLR